MDKPEADAVQIPGLDGTTAAADLWRRSAVTHANSVEIPRTDGSVDVGEL